MKANGDQTRRRVATTGRRALAADDEVAAVVALFGRAQWEAARADAALVAFCLLLPALGFALFAADLRAGLPADHQAAFAGLAGMPWAAAQQSLAGLAHYVTLLETGYAVHELVFGLLFLVIVAFPFRHGERWAWWACWAALIADVAYTLTFGRYDPTIHRQSLIADIALPVLLLAQLSRFFGRRPAGASSTKPLA